jgi:hypothetical protein
MCAGSVKVALVQVFWAGAKVVPDANSIAVVTPTTNATRSTHSRSDDETANDDLRRDTL